MKHKGLSILLLFLLLLFAAMPAVAQQKQKFYIESFGENSFDMSAREKPTSRDDGTGKLYAIIKVRSTDPDDDLKAYNLDFDYLKDVQEVHDGVLWVYVQYGAKTVTIKRDGFYTVERYDLRTTLQPGKVYDMRIKPEPKVISMQFLMFQVTPADSKAMIMYSEEGGSEKVFGQLDEQGCSFKKLVLGKYYYKIISENYHDSEGVVTLSSPNGKHTEKVTLRPNFSRVTLLVENGAEIYINDEKRGTGQWSGNLTPGIYSIECRKANHKSTVETITVEDGGNFTRTLKAPTPIVGVLSLTSTPIVAKITVDGVSHGETPNIIEGVLIGNHKVTLSKDGYETTTVDIVVRENETTEHNVQLKKVEPPVAPASSQNNVKYNGSAAVNSGNATFTVNGVSFKMISVKGGTYLMGNDNGLPDEKPAHSVTLSDYYIGETEVTQALWQAVMGSNPSDFKGNNNPVDCVSYNDCITFINKLNILLGKQLPAGIRFRLPTEAEWEYAARGGNQSRDYKYCGGNTLDNVAWYSGNSGGKTHPVKQKQPNELGVYDMSGNVFEWCSDWSASYSSSSQTNPTGPSSGSERVRRGGYWNSTEVMHRVRTRSGGSPSGYCSYFGLRLALDGGALGQSSASSAQNTVMSGSISNHEYVDLGLSVLWATCNIGAAAPYEFGNYYAWGETVAKNNFYQNYSFGTSPNIGKDISGTKYDAAKANWGDDWCMPTKAHWEELISKCNWEWTTMSNHNGYKVTGPSGKSIFLPAAGWYLGHLGNNFKDKSCHYWSSYLSDEYSFDAYSLNGKQTYPCSVEYGLPIRPILSPMSARLKRLRAEKESYDTLVGEESKNYAPTFGIR